ncbi:uncharacterized protein LOC142355777 [Convolutriloba macropyga]|uniref:uncharacterized protein LOC142355777 n=1 Tax=Convolutriloba macropyga TaxID=536237 RepID=UPI003F52002F
MSFPPENTVRFAPYFIKDILYTEHPDTANKTENVVALLRLRQAITDVGRYLRICERADRQGDLIGVTGMGSISRTEKLYPSLIQEALFTVNFLQKGFVPVIDPLQFCSQRDICTDKIEDANSCLGDGGSPVYQFECIEENGVQVRRPKCLYGIVKPTAVALKDQSGEYLGCNGEEIFLNVTDMLPQITQLITTHIAV